MYTDQSVGKGFSMQKNRLVATFVALAMIPAMPAFAKKPALELAGVACDTPPPEHCPEANCPGPMVIESRHCGRT